jgi:penicillin-binding protein 2
MVAPKHFDTIIAGMAKVCVPGGTAGRTGIEGIEICGKTGTAQNPHGKDHSVFIAFAPRVNPKIAICVIVENGGFGADFAAPIANLMIERFLAKDRSETSKKPEMLNRMLKSDLIGNTKDSTKKSN